jgi:hypothetical protein
MYGEMFTDTEAASDIIGATHAATSFNTAAYCFAERDRGAAPHSAASSDTAADAYRFAASYSRTPTVSHSNSELVNEKEIHRSIRTCPP